MNISTFNEENSNLPSSSGQVLNANNTKKANEEALSVNTENNATGNPEKVSSLVEKNVIEKPAPAPPTAEKKEIAGNRTETSGSLISDAEPTMKENKVDTNESSGSSARDENPASVLVDDTGQNPNTDVKNDSNRDGERQDRLVVIDTPKKRTRKKWKKPVGKPNRPLSAYNLYFKKERAIMLGDAAKKADQETGKKRVHRKTHGKIGFAEMAKIIGAKWKKLPDEEKEEFVKIAVVKKEKYAKDLADWREEQKKKAIINSMGLGPKSKVGKFSHDDDDLVQQIAEDREKLLRQHQAFRMQMIQEMQVGHLGRLPGEGHGRQMPTIEYLRNMQDDRTGQFFGRNRNGAPSSLFSHYPSAAEGSGRDLYQQMVAMTSGPEGQGRESDQFRQLKMARGTMGSMGGAIGESMGNSINNPRNAPMGSNGIGMVPISKGGSRMPNSAPRQQYEMECYHHMRHQNQMHGMNNGQRGMASHEGPTYNNMEVSMRRFQQYGRYN